MRRFFPRGLAALALSSGLVAFGFFDERPLSPVAVAVHWAVFLAGFPLATMFVDGWVEQRFAHWPRWKRRVLLLGVGFGLGVPSVLAGPLGNGEPILHVRWPFVPYLFACGALCGALFRLVADGLVWVTASARSLKRRLEVLGVLTAAASLLLFWVLSRFCGPEGWVLVGPMVLCIAWGLSGIGGARLTEQLTQAASALERLGRGDLSVELSPQGDDEVATMSRAFNQAVLGLREKDFLERAFGRYVAHDVLAALRAEGKLQLAPSRKVATVLFADIRGFTSMSETASPEEVMTILNVYLGRVVELVREHGGYLNKFIGDAVMVIFGAPGEQPDHAARAIACGRAIQDAVAELNQRGAFGARTLSIGVGVNTGPLVAGSLGGAERAEYTVIGDTVNVASRLTSAAKGGEVLVGESCAQAAAGEQLVALDPIRVKGKSEPLAVFQARRAA